MKKILLVPIFLLSFHCSSNTSSQSSHETDTNPILSSVTNWTYQLQNIVPADIGASAFDLAVIDYSADGDDATAFTSAEVEIMRSNDDTKKLMLSYLSIGEAEDYRYYFDADASYMDIENPDWAGNFKVFYWEDEWQVVIEGYLDKIVAAGFDGVYLDIIDAYEYYGEGGDSGLERASAADDMVNFVIRLSEHARETNPNFLVFPQNGAGIINDSTLVDEYFAAIDGIGAEDSFYFGDEDENNPLDEQTDTLADLDTFVNEGKLVLSVDYLTEADKVDDYYERAENHDYIPYATVRELDALTVNLGHTP